MSSSSDSEKDLVASIKFEDYFKPEVYEINEEAEQLRQRVKEEQPSELEVRDFAYASKDPRHWGLKAVVNDLEESDVSSEENDSEIDFSSFSQWDSSYFVPFVDIDVEKFFDEVDKTRLIEYAFERQQKESENDEKSSHRESQELSKSELESKLDLGKLKLKIYNAKSLFDFRKETEWEMSLNEGEALFLIATEEPEEEIDIPEELKDELKHDMNAGLEDHEEKGEESNEKETEDKKEDSKNIEGEGNGEKEKQDEQPVIKPLEDTKNEEDVKAIQSTDRIGSIDELNEDTEQEEDPLTILSNSYNFPHPVDVEIRPHGFYYDLLQYIESSSDYGNGWVLGIKANIRCRRRFKNKKRLRKKRAIKMKLKIVDIGLIPENYVEVCSDSENEL